MAFTDIFDGGSQPSDSAPSGDIFAPKAPAAAPSSSYSKPSSGFFGFHLPKLGLGNALSSLAQIPGALVGMAEHPSRLPQFGRATAASFLSAAGRVVGNPLNALTDDKLLGKNYDTQLDEVTGYLAGKLTGANALQTHELEAQGSPWQKGILPGLIQDVGSLTIPAQIGGGLAKLGELGKLGEAGAAADRAAELGVPAEDIASKAEDIKNATPGQRALSRVPVLNRLNHTAADLAGGGSALNDAARAQAATDGIDASKFTPEEIAARQKLLETLHQAAHPLSTLGKDVFRPLARAAEAASIPKTENKFQPILKDELTQEAHQQIDPVTGEVTPGTSRPVTNEEFQQIAQRGQDRLDAAAAQGHEPVKLNANWDNIVNHAYDTAGPGREQPWSGETIDAHTGKLINPKAGLATTIKAAGQDTVTVAQDASPEEFRAAMDQARQTFADQLKMKGAKLGVFHDATKGTIEIDPVMVAATKDGAEELSAASHSLGGAYDYATGNGHFAPHVDEEAAAAARDARLTPEPGTVGPAENRLAAAMRKPIPEWAKNLVEKLPPGVNAKLARTEGKLMTHDLTKIKREYERNLEVTRNRTLRSPAVTLSRVAAQALVDDGLVSTPAEASKLVFDHMSRQLDGQVFAAKAAADGDPELEAHMIQVTSGSDPIPKEYLDAHPEVAKALADAGEQWKALRQEARDTLLGGVKGSTGLEATLADPVLQMTPAQAKEYRDISRAYGKARGLMSGVDKEAETTRKAIMEKGDTMTKLGAKAELQTEQAKAQAAEVLRTAGPASVSTPERRAATIGTIVARTNTDSHVLYDTAADKVVVFSKDATEEDRADPAVRVTQATGKAGTYERYAVPIFTQDVGAMDWGTNAPAIMEQFMEEHATALASPDVKVGVDLGDNGVMHVRLMQSTITTDGGAKHFLTMGQAHILATARAVDKVTDMVRNDWRPSLDAMSGKIAAQHVPEVMKANSTLNRFLRQNEDTLTKLRQTAIDNGDTPHVSDDDFRNNLDFFQRIATTQTKAPTLDKFYGGIAVEMRKGLTDLPASAMFQINLNLPINMATWDKVVKYLGPETDTALRWYNTQHDTIESQFRGKNIDLLDPATGNVKTVDMADLMYSLLAVTSVNASPLSNVGTALKGLASITDYQKTGEWADKFRAGLKTYADAWDRRFEGAGASGQLSEKSPIAAEQLFKDLVGTRKVGMYTSVRADVLHVLSGNLLDDWTNADIAKRFGRELPQLGDERESMEAGGSSAYAKIRSFHENLKSPDTSRGVTLDRVMAFAFGVPGGNWTGAQYARVANAVRDLADQISVARYGKVGVILPHHVQAAIWVAAKDMANDIGRGRFLNDVSDTLASIRDGSFKADDNPMTNSIKEDIALGPTKGIEDRQITVRPGVKQDALEHMNKLPKAKRITIHEQRQPGDIKAAQAQLEVKYASSKAAQPVSWGAKAIEIEKAIKQGDTARAEQIVMGHANAVVLHDFANEAQNMDVFSADAGSLRGVGPGTLGTVDELRRAGVIAPLHQAMSYEPSNAAELQGLAAGADAEHAAATDTLHDLATPPMLYHGTAPGNVESIAREGLKPDASGRIFASEDRAVAQQYADGAPSMARGNVPGEPGGKVVGFRAPEGTPPEALRSGYGISAPEGIPASDLTFFQKYAEDEVLGATYTNTKTGRLTMAFFKSADAGTLAHEGAHVLRQYLTDEEVQQLERSFGAKAGTTAFEEKWAHTFTSYLNGVPAGEKYAGLVPMFARVKSALSTIWEGMHGHLVDRIDPGVAQIIDKYLAPDEVAEAPPLPTFDRLLGKTPEQIAANLPKREGETQAQSLRRGYLAGKAVTRQQWLEEKSRQTLQNRAVVAKQRNDLAQALQDRTLPKVAAMDRTMRKLATRANKLALSVEDTGKPPAQWQPVWEGYKALTAAAVDDPQIALALSNFAGSFSELVQAAEARGFDPTHISSLSEQDVRRLVYSPVSLARKNQSATIVESGTRKARQSADYRTRSIEALVAAQVDVGWERETNNYISVIERYATKPYVEGTPGFQAWDPIRSFLLQDPLADVAKGLPKRAEPTLMVPDAVANSIRSMTKDYSHSVWQNVGHTRIIRGWKALVLTYNPGHYVNVALNQAVLAAIQGVSLRDYVTALVNLRTGETGDFARAAKWLEAHGKGTLPDSVDVNDLRGIGANSEFAEATDGARAQRALVRPATVGIGDAEGVRAKLGAGTQQAARVQDRLNAFNASLHRLSRAATYVAGRRQGLSDIEAMNRSYEALVDYGNLSGFERAAMTSIFPFYGFQKGLLQIMARFPIDHPLRASLALQLASLNQQLTGGGLPQYYQMLAHIPGTNLMGSTKSINPFADAASLGTAAGIASSMNPVLSLVAEQAFNGSDGYVSQYKIDQFGNTVPDTSAAADIQSVLETSPEGGIFSDLLGGGTGGVGRGIIGGLGTKTYTPAQIAKLKTRLTKSKLHTSGTQYQTWQNEAKPKPKAAATSGALPGFG